jgi:hypothetical protein
VNQCLKVYSPIDRLSSRKSLISSSFGIPNG